MQFSTGIEYAIHGLVYLTANRSDSAVLVGDIAKAIKVPESYLRKVFQVLVRAGLVSSQRGARGGFVLARDPSRITLKHVVEGMDGSLPLYTCMKVRRKCSALEPCPVSAAFEQAQQKMAEVLDATNLETLAAGISRKTASWLKVTECA
jgi:Rrf2 family protein